jgi:hypothetical protein
MSDHIQRLAIGELARRAGTAPSALRYRPTGRSVSGLGIASGHRESLAGELPLPSRLPQPPRDHAIGVDADDRLGIVDPLGAPT